MAEIADLFATLGLKFNAGQWAQADAQIRKTQQAMTDLDKYAQSLGVSRGAVLTAARNAAAQEREAERSKVAAIRAAQRQEREEIAAARRSQVASVRLAAAQRRAVEDSMRKAADAAKKAHGESAVAAEESAKRTEHAFGYAKAAILAALAYVAGHSAYEHLIKFNQEMQDNTISLSAMIQGQLGGSFASASDKAKDLYGEWQKFSTQTPVTTAEIVEFGKNIAAATFGAKGTVKDLTEITEQGVIAAKVLAGNRNAGYAALEISEMLMGNVSNRMMFVKQLLGMIHMTEEEFRALDDKGRLAAVKKALGADAFKDAAQAFGQSFSGVTSTLWDKLQIVLGKIGLPLFERIIKAVTTLNEWLDKNSATISRIGGAIADGLAVAWDLVVGIWNKAYQVFTDNREVIMSMAESVGRNLWTAFQLLVVVLDEAIAQVDRFLKFTDHGLGKFLLDALEMPGLLTVIAELLERIGVDLSAISHAAFGGFGDIIGDIFGKDDKAKAKKRTAEAGPGISVNDALSRRAQELTDQAGQASSPEDRDQLLERSARLRGMIPAEPTAQPALPASTGPVAMNVDVGDIHVYSQSADPEAVAQEVHRVFDEKLGNHLRRTMDEVA